MTARPAESVEGLESILTAVTWLFCPGDRPERFDRAAVSGADVVVLDLEDAVAPGAKDAARDHVRRWLAEGGRAVVRINPPGTEHFEADVAAVGDLALGVMLPKADAASARQLACLTVSPVVALVETAAGVVRAAEVAALPAVARLALGSFDLAAEIGVDPTTRAALDPARTALVYASAAAGLPAPVDGVCAAVHDVTALRREVDLARALGLHAKLCIHPAQLSVVRDALRPSPQELAWASTVVAAVGPDGLAVVDGAMVDRPVVLRAQRILLSASSKGTS